MKSEEASWYHAYVSNLVRSSKSTSEGEKDQSQKPLPNKVGYLFEAVSYKPFGIMLISEPALSQSENKKGSRHFLSYAIFIRDARPYSLPHYTRLSDARATLKQ